MAFKPVRMGRRYALGRGFGLARVRHRQAPACI